MMGVVSSKASYCARAHRVINMAFKCQRDSYLQQFRSAVVSCNPAKLGERTGYEAVLSDTILFPGGGGQPDDRGKIGGIDVLNVVRRGVEAIHFVPDPLEVGATVEIEVDWTRRFDHMQQHSGQHLITAITDREYGIKTTSWNLAIGEDNRCLVELATPTLTPSQVSRIEDLCNESIRNRIPMTPRWYTTEAPELEAVRSRGLPDDFEGSEVRVVEIEGIDSNMCCGTHVSNLSHLQCIKLLYTESKKGSTLLYYLTGNRVLRYAQRSLTNEKALTKLLSCGLDEHKEAVEKIQKSSKQANKVVRNQLREIAQLLASRHLSTSPPDPVACIHRDDGDNDFMSILANELAAKGILVLVTIGGDKGAGHFLLAGTEEEVSELGPKVSLLLEGKGGGRKGRFQGKVKLLERRGEAEAMIREFVQQSRKPK